VHSFRVVMGIGLIFNVVALIAIIAGIVTHMHVMDSVFSVIMLIAAAFYAYALFISLRRHAR
jgi:threonine/homoserine/homoserine lactone efflux protein